MSSETKKHICRDAGRMCRLEYYFSVQNNQNFQFNFVIILAGLSLGSLILVHGLEEQWRHNQPVTYMFYSGKL